MTVDSGAGESLHCPMNVPDFHMKPSAEQAKGTDYLMVGGARLPSLGENHKIIKA